MLFNSQVSGSKLPCEIIASNFKCFQSVCTSSKYQLTGKICTFSHPFQRNLPVLHSL